MLTKFKFFNMTSMTLLGLLVLCACSSKAKEVQSKQAALYFGAGTQSLMSQDYTEALKNLLKANELEPENSEILNNLGMAYYFKGDKQMGIRTLEKALKINEENSDVMLNLASIAYKDGNYQRAEDLYKKVQKDLTYDKQARTFYNLGLIELKKRDLAKAESYFKKSVAEDEDYCPSHFQMGLLLYSKKQFNRALTSFKEATMGTCTNSPDAHYYQAATLTELKRFNEARIKLDEVESKFAKTPYAAKARAKVLELNNAEARDFAGDSHASRKMLESPDF